MARLTQRIESSRIFGTTGSWYPATASNLAAVSIDESNIYLTWTDNSNIETGYYVNKYNGSVFTNIATLGASVTSYTSSGLSPQTLYYYSVAPYKTDGFTYTSNTSSVASASTEAYVTASGGTVTDGDGYRTHSFTTSGNFLVLGAGTIECLVVAGGGSGGGKVGGQGGGGGGGEVLAYTLKVPAYNWYVEIGDGGTHVTTNTIDGGNAPDGNNGGSSYIYGLGGAPSAAGGYGGKGGSGNDIYVSDVGGDGGNSGNNTYSGGTHYDAFAGGGGGGGGGGGYASSVADGSGGSGRSVWGTAYGAGGSGGPTSGNGAANTGNGGGGGDVYSYSGGGGTYMDSGNGGSGIIKFRYKH
jgi:hypothetical protein